MTGEAAFWRLVAALCAAGFGLLALFVAAPGLDLAAAGLFGGPQGFALERSAPVEAARAAYHAAFLAFCAAAAVGLAGRLAAPQGARVPAALWAYAAGVAALGPGLIANLVFKSHWGRARPNDLALFGGDAAFTGPFEMAAECTRNCSFVSGEGAAAAAVAAGLAGLFWPRGRAAQAAAAAAMALWLAGAVWMRLAPGGHFLSDSLFAFVLTGLAAAALHRALGVGRRRAGVGPADFAADLARAAQRTAAAALRLAAAVRARIGRVEPAPNDDA
jgi:lipid A 4'-phosphatase